MPVLRFVPALAAAVVAGLAAAQPAPGAPGAGMAKVREACAADYLRLCAGAEPGHGAMQCMRAHFQEVSPDCRAAVMAHRAEMKARRADRARSAVSTPDPAPH